MKCFARKAGDPNAGCFWCLIASFFFSPSSLDHLLFTNLAFFSALVCCRDGLGLRLWYDTAWRGVFSTILFFAPYFFSLQRSVLCVRFEKAMKEGQSGHKRKRHKYIICMSVYNYYVWPKLGYLSCQKMPQRRKRVLSCRNYYFYNIYIRFAKW